MRLSFFFSGREEKRYRYRVNHLGMKRAGVVQIETAIMLDLFVHRYEV